MAAKAINRYVWLINTLMQRKSLTFKEICDLWDKSSLTDGKSLALRTFHQHRDIYVKVNICGLKIDLNFI